MSNVNELPTSSLNSPLYGCLSRAPSSFISSIHFLQEHAPWREIIEALDRDLASRLLALPPLPYKSQPTMMFASTTAIRTRVLPTVVASSSSARLLPSRRRLVVLLSSRNNNHRFIASSSSASCLSSHLYSFDRQSLQNKEYYDRRYYQKNHYKKYEFSNKRWSSNNNTSASAATITNSKEDDTTTKSDDSTKTSSITPTQKNIRIATELGRHVWPSLPSDKSKSSKEYEHAMAMRQRVIASVSLMLAGKGVTIATPFMFKGLVDTLPMFNTNNAIIDVDGVSTTANVHVPTFIPETLIETLTTSTTFGIPSLPLLLLLSYGTSRTLSSLFQESRNAVFAPVAQSAIRSVGRSTFDHVHSLDLQYHLNRNTGTLGRIIERGNRSISFVLNAMVFNTIPTIIEVSVVTGCMGYTFGASHAGTILATIGAYVGYTIGITQWRTQFRKDMNRLNNQASGKISDSLLNYETVKYFNNEGHEGRVYEGTLRQYQHAALQAQSSLALLNFGQNAIFTVGLTTIMYLTLLDVMAGNATVGDLVLVNGLLFQLSVPLNFIGGVYREVQQAFVDMEAMFGLRDTEPAIVDRKDAVEYDPMKDGGCVIEFDNLEFAYDLPKKKQEKTKDGNIEEEQGEAKRPILRGTTFTVPQGKTIAIVGTSGCGKSTLLRLLYRFYAPDSGTIRIGGNDISTYTTESIRKAMAVVPQDIVLFNDTIGYNINYGNLNASWDEVVEAAKKSHLHDIIQTLPNGYDTIVGERGLKLSGGEKQRVSLARAILKKSPILLCDEPTSSLDSHTELEIMNNLKEVGKDTTCIIIAHRLSTIQDCDCIIVMDEGRVIEVGDHNELMVQGGRYSELVAFQRSHVEGNNGSNSDKDLND